MPALRVTRSFATFFALILFFQMTAYAAEKAGRDLYSDDDDPKAPWHITADEIRHDQKTDQYIGTGNVLITKKNRRLSADTVRFDHRNMEVYADGHVTLIAGQDSLIAGRLEMDLNSETGTAYDATLFFKANHFYIRGDVIKKIGKETYTVKRATVTTCDGDRPAWKITGRNLKATVEGYGTAWSTTLWAKQVPVLYSPFMVFPLKSERQSGFLPPQFSSSDRKGIEYNQPFFWAINENTDATIYGHYMEKRGTKFGAEYRYVLDEASRGTMMFDYLDDRKIDDGTPDASESWGYDDDAAPRPNPDRYWFRMKHNHGLPAEFTAKLDLDIVSDQDYLNEFKNGYSGFDQTENYFIGTFGRELDEYNDPVRVNRFNLSRSWHNYSMNAEARWYDDVVARRQSGSDATLQKLPFFEFTGFKQPVFGSPVYYDFSTEYVHFFRQEGDTGHRADIYPRVYLPSRFKNYFTFEPSIGLRETVWQINEDDGASNDADWKSNRALYDIKVDLASDLYRIFEVHSEGIESSSINRIKHTLQPQILYDYIPELDQEDYPFFDDIDRIEKENLITYSITNTFTSRAEKPKTRDHSSPENADDELVGKPAEEYMYNHLCRLKIGQSFDVNRWRDEDPKPFLPVEAELELIPFYYLSILSDAGWSTYDNEFVTHNLAMQLADIRGDRAYVEHRYERDVGENIYFNFFFRINSKLSVYSEYEADLYSHNVIKTAYGFLYQSQCWSIDVTASEEEDDRRFEFRINLHGLGQFGTGFDEPHGSRVF